MHRGFTKVWLSTLLGLSLVVFADFSRAENPRAPVAVNEWQKGRKLSPPSEQTLRLCAGTQVRLAADSKIEVLGKIPLPTSIQGVGPFAETARLLQGRLDVTVNPKKGPANAVILYGPRRTTLLVSGGQVAVVVTGNGVAMGVYEGREASISIGATWKHIAAGNMLVISAEHPEGLESHLPPIPVKVAVTRPVLAVAGLGDPSRAVWQELPDVVGYRVKLRDTQSDELKYVETKKAAIQLDELSPGRYELRVAALAEFGLDGTYSEPTYVNVVGIELPPGGYFSGGKAFMEPGQQLKLTHVEGLEMTYDGATVYFNAVGRTGLRNGQASTFHLRLPGAAERVSLQIAPRSLDTKIELTPALARWPRDKVHIVVQLPKAIAQSTRIELSPTVTVNNQPIELQWVRTENTLQTVILGPPLYPGPWVLRAQVTDQHGYVLGHNFLEIASMAGQKDEELPVEVRQGTLSVQAKR